MAEDRRNTFHLTGLRLHRTDGQQRVIPIRPISPVESRVSIEDLESAHEENDQAQRIDPVRDPDGQRMAIGPYHRIDSTRVERGRWRKRVLDFARRRVQIRMRAARVRHGMGSRERLSSG